MRRHYNGMPKAPAFILRTLPMYDKGEFGEFVLEVEISDQELRQSVSPKELCFSRLAFTLASALLDTGTPKEIWQIEPSLEMQAVFNLPSIIPIDQIGMSS